MIEEYYVMYDTKSEKYWGGRYDYFTYELDAAKRFGLSKREQGNIKRSITTNLAGMKQYGDAEWVGENYQRKLLTHWTKNEIAKRVKVRKLTIEKIYTASFVKVTHEAGPLIGMLDFDERYWAHMDARSLVKEMDES